MTTEFPTPASLDQLWAERFATLPKDCGELAEPGTDEVEEWRDWTVRETTQDQIRIEEVLERRLGRKDAILHIGVGNSGLAKRFFRRCQAIVGTTISEPERRYADQLGLKTYSVFLNNKYAGVPIPGFEAFDYIVDNNPTAFGCCRKHLVLMMNQYRSRLKPAGLILTDRRGLGWVTSAPGANPRWAFSFEDWEALGRIFGLHAARLTDDVYALAVSEEALLRRSIASRFSIWIQRRRPN